MANKNINLSQLFGTVASALTDNQQSLNQADTYNHDHGDNMVQTFEVITQAMKEKSTATPAEQLAYASQLLQAKGNSGSAKLYAEGLQNASAKFQGKKIVTPNNAMTLLQALMGTQSTVSPQTLQAQAQSVPNTASGADLLGSLLEGLTGTSQSSSSGNSAADILGSLLGGSTGSTQSSSNSQSGSDLLGSLLGGLTGSSSSSGSSTGGININQLLKAGMSYMSAKKSGSNNMEAILQAIMAGSKVGNQGYRAQSGTLVANTLMQALSQMGK